MQSDPAVSIYQPITTTLAPASILRPRVSKQSHSWDLVRLQISHSSYFVPIQHRLLVRKSPVHMARQFDQLKKTLAQETFFSLQASVSEWHGKGISLVGNEVSVNYTPSPLRGVFEYLVFSMASRHMLRATCYVLANPAPTGCHQLLDSISSDVAYSISMQQAIENTSIKDRYSRN
ncbi:uncharacterized protein BO95DRAFT_82968 [Aspergillus brunneoviolaceus CBS 621.78]|uniref:Uncharacterized protein n=1 Tax=Aspergillus brunneoviolaceus CBS 621.78 TaxID=1450534 RepID=A0ACD1GEZ2_9EURO|nr:hypothetical protein BO95DRAFT_82968 [Aspergillus brunneoviolaceus CBS 621.78]RAH47656.1 hypothetical protein BO95DRAFT_82968 [Aspergillus brunneoviolaceus CBS 621.78]